ncbi:MAG: helix-turn-helix transcriptional regulator [Nitrospirae bacterium]|nr:helix-turn-helix transcriptional regulator [Nitrospirota bacterium]
MRNRRRALGLSQEAVAERLGISYQQVQKYEKGVSSFSVERLTQLATIMDVGPGYFLGAGVSADLQPAARKVRGRAETLLTEAEWRWIRLFRRVRRPSQRAAFMALLKALARP